MPMLRSEDPTVSSSPTPPVAPNGPSTPAAMAFIAVLLDPSDSSVQAVPVLADTPDEALDLLANGLASLQPRGLYDLATLVGWLQALDGLEQPGERFLAVVAVNGRSEAVPLLAPSEHAAAVLALDVHPGGQINGLFSRAVLAGFIDAVEGLITEEHGASGEDRAA